MYQREAPALSQAIGYWAAVNIRVEKLMGTDPSTLWALALWLQALLLVALGGVWAWHRWGRAQAWIMFLPPTFLICLYASGQVVRLLPNVM